MAKKSSKSSTPKARGARKPKLARTPAHTSSRPRPSRDGHVEIIARGVLLRGQRVLLCENTKHGYLYLPGGHVEFTESASAALRREFLEETGADVSVGRLMLVDEGVFETKKATHHELNLVFHVERTGDTKREITSREAGIAFRWVDLAAVPELDIRPVAAKAFLAAGAGTNSPDGGAEWVSALG